MARKPKAKQGHLDGMDPPRVKKVDDRADAYFEVMQALSFDLDVALGPESNGDGEEDEGDEDAD